MKPGLDKFAAAAVLLALFPLLVLVIVTLAIANRGHVWFRQTRPGKDEKLFTLLKFKTMNDLRGADGQLLPDEKRLTKIGKVVRKTSLDELPQFWNVLRGDMSIVGPRPLLVEYLPLYNDRQRVRHRVRPGITGWAQVNGRNTLEWQRRFELDVWYVERQSFLLDIKILFLTVVKVVSLEGVNSKTSVTMEPFRGNR